MRSEAGSRELLDLALADLLDTGGEILSSSGARMGGARDPGELDSSSELR